MVNTVLDGNNIPYQSIACQEQPDHNDDNDDNDDTNDDEIGRTTLTVHHPWNTEDEEIQENQSLTGHQEENELVATTGLTSSSSSQLQVLRQVLHHNFLSDEKATIAGIHLVEGSTVVKLLKFTLLTYLGIYVTFYMVRLVGWEHDDKFTLDNFWTFECNLVAGDIVIFYAVGRLFRQRGVDHLAWIMTVGASGLFSSGITNFTFLQHSATLYEMHCTWPWQLWAFVAIVVPLVTALVMKHLGYAYRTNTLLIKVIEFLLCMWFLLVPFLSSPYVHFHHWYVGKLTCDLFLVHHHPILW